MFPSVGVGFLHLDDEVQRRGAARAVNRYHEEFAGFRDRLLPVAVIPMHTPEEAIEELDMAAQLGFTAAVIPSYVRLPSSATSSGGAPTLRSDRRLDSFGLDSEHDYDPVWKRFVELGMSVASHSGLPGGSRCNRRAASFTTTSGQPL